LQLPQWVTLFTWLSINDSTKHVNAIILIENVQSFSNAMCDKELLVVGVISRHYQVYDSAPERTELSFWSSRATSFESNIFADADELFSTGNKVQNVDVCIENWWVAAIATPDVPELDTVLFQRNESGKVIQCHAISYHLIVILDLIR
jgi:hypothetical protein